MVSEDGDTLQILNCNHFQMFIFIGNLPLDRMAYLYDEDGLLIVDIAERNMNAMPT